MENSKPESTTIIKEPENSNLDHCSGNNLSSGKSTLIKTKANFPFILFIIATIVLNGAVTAAMLYYYHNHHATKIIAFDFTRFKNTLVDEIITGNIKQEESGTLVNNLKDELSKRTKKTNALILLREVIVDGDVEEIDPDIRWLQK